MCLFSNLGNRESLLVVREDFFVPSEALFTRGVGNRLFVDSTRFFALFEGGRWLLETLFEITSLTAHIVSAAFLKGGNKRIWLVEPRYSISALIFMAASLRNAALVTLNAKTVPK
jgi:hypothetical protein